MARPANSAEFAQQLTAAREKKGINRAELARRIGIEPSTVSKYEGALRTPTPERTAQINTVLGSELQLPASAAAAAAPAKKVMTLAGAIKAASKRTPTTPPKKAAKKATKAAAKATPTKATPKKVVTKKVAAKKVAAKKVVAKSIPTKTTKKTTKKPVRTVTAAATQPASGPARLLIEVREGQVRAFNDNGEVAALVLDFAALHRTAPSKQLATLASMMGEIAKLPQPLYRRAAESLARRR